MKIRCKLLDGDALSISFRSPRQTAILNQQAAVSRASRALDALPSDDNGPTPEQTEALAEIVLVALRFLGDHAADDGVDSDWFNERMHYEAIMRAHNELLMSRQPDPMIVGESDGTPV